MNNVKATNFRINQLFVDLNRAINLNRKKFLTKPFNNIEQFLNQLVDHQIIKGYSLFDKKWYQLTLAYGPSTKHVLKEIKYHSRPGKKVFISLKDICKFKQRDHLKMLGFVRTRFGFFTLQTCYKLKTGGELLVTLKS